MRQFTAVMWAAANWGDGPPACLPTLALLPGCTGRQRDVTPVGCHPPSHMSPHCCGLWEVCPPICPQPPACKHLQRRETGAKRLQGCYPSFLPLPHQVRSVPLGFGWDCLALFIPPGSGCWLGVPKLVARRAALWSQLSVVGKRFLGLATRPWLDLISRGGAGTLASLPEHPFPITLPSLETGAQQGATMGLVPPWDPQHCSSVNLAPGNRCNGEIMEQILRNS